MKLLLADILRRWWWLFALAGAWSVFATVVISQTSEFAYFWVLAYFFPLFYALFGTYSELKTGWTRVAMTMPVRREAIGTALWVSGVLLLPGLLAVAAIVAMPLRALIPRFLPGEPLNWAAFDLLLTPLVAAVITSSMCLAAECLAETVGRANTATAGWKAWVWSATPMALMVPALGVLGVVLRQAPLAWRMMDRMHIVACAVGVVLMIPSFRYRHWLVADVSEPTLLKIAWKPAIRDTGRMPSYWWSAWRWHVIAASAILGFWAFLYTVWYIQFVAQGEELGSMSRAMGEAPALIYVYIAFFACVATFSLFPLQAYRLLPLSSGRLTLRIVTFPAIVYVAVLAGVLPDIFLGDPSVPIVVLKVWISFGTSLLMLAAFSGHFGTRRGYLEPVVYAIGLFVLLSYPVPPMWACEVAMVLTAAGVWRLYAAVTRSSHGYHLDSWARGLRWR